LIETRQLSKSVEGLNNSVALAAGELWPKMLVASARLMGFKKLESHHWLWLTIVCARVLC